MEVLRSRDIYEDMGKHADGIGVAAHHHVAEADIVVSGEVSGHDSGKHGFLIEFDVVEGFEGKAKVAEEAVNS